MTKSEINFVIKIIKNSLMSKPFKKSLYVNKIPSSRLYFGDQLSF
ncbi:MAG: hypothetical protein CM15mP93_16870 [Thiotrichaceae bacterium]|nr:MAG: hypothetical protein CM15mP93_16870 [Thiotrichaceae bacterium]